MSLKIKNNLLTGPFAVDETVVRPNQKPSVYVVVTKAGEPWNPTFQVLEVGETGAGGLTFSIHPNKEAWMRAEGKVSIYLLGSDRDAAGRQAIVTEIKNALAETGWFIPMQGAA